MKTGWQEQGRAAILDYLKPNSKTAESSRHGRHNLIYASGKSALCKMNNRWWHGESKEAEKKQSLDEES